MQVVIDTNILVSALWSKNGAPAKVISMVLSGLLIPCYEYRIICEYREVLLRPKFGFTQNEVSSLLSWFESFGRSVVAETCEDGFIDESDKKFYEVARFCNAKLITGNLKHFPPEPDILAASDFLGKYSK